MFGADSFETPINPPAIIRPRGRQDKERRPLPSDRLVRQLVPPSSPENCKSTGARTAECPGAPIKESRSSKPESAHSSSSYSSPGKRARSPDLVGPQESSLPSSSVSWTENSGICTIPGCTCTYALYAVGIAFQLPPCNILGCIVCSSTPSSNARSSSVTRSSPDERMSTRNPERLTAAQQAPSRKTFII